MCKILKAYCIAKKAHKGQKDKEVNLILNILFMLQKE